MNGGEASPGDTLRYTITLTETAGGQARNVSLTDDVPDDVTFGGFVSVPAGATSSFTAAPAGANGNGIVNVSAINVPASSSVTVVFDVTVVAGTLPGTNINNTASLNNPNGPENNPAAPAVVVNPSLIPSAGTKFVYLHRTAAGVRSLSRVVPTAADTNEPVANGTPDTCTITPALQTAFAISANPIPVRLWLTRSSNNPGSRSVTVTLTSSNGYTTTVANSITPPNSATTPTLFSFNLPNTLVRNFPAGTTFTLTVSNAGSNNITIWPNGNGAAGNNSRIEFPATTVINVDSVATYSAAFNGGAVQTTFYPGANVFVRAQISDPFGSFDIGSARITIIDPANVTQVNNLLMTAQGAPATCNSTSAASCIFQYQYAVPASPVARRLDGAHHRQRRHGRHGHRPRRRQFHRRDPAAFAHDPQDLDGAVGSGEQHHEPETHSARRGALRRDRDQQRTRHRGRRHAGDHRPDSGRRLDVRVDHVGQPGGVPQWRDRRAGSRIRMRHMCRIRRRA